MLLNLPDLPVSAILSQLAAALSQHDKVVLQAPTGAGKTTLVPLYLLDLLDASGKIIMLEPRRIAAFAAATRMADLLREPVGKTVGYRMQLETKVSKETRIEVVTEGILLRMLQENPELSGISTLIFDEFHERSMQSDLGLALALQCQEYFREEPLNILLMSATLQADQLSSALSAPVVISEGFLYPVNVIHRERPLPDRRFHTLCNEVSSTIRKALQEHSGSILAFLPGAGEIRQVASILESQGLGNDVELHSLFGDMSLTHQRKAIEPCPEGQRKVVLATNIAETSLTIDGITVVVDSGMVRKAVYDPGSGMTRLETRRTSQSSADQRKGRAGRLASGTCYRLTTESEHQSSEKSDRAEIMESDLSSLALNICNWGTTPSELFWLSPPPERRYEEALSLLEQLSAIHRTPSDTDSITPQGKAMVRLGVHPRIAHLLLISAQRGWLQEGCLLAAILSEQDVFKGQLHRGSDILTRIDAFQSSQSGLNQQVVRRIRQLSSQWYKRLKPSEKSRQDTDNLYARLLLAAYPDRVAQARKGSHHYLLSSGQGAELKPDDSLMGHNYLVVPDLGGDKKQANARIFVACPVDKDVLYEELIDQIKELDITGWDKQQQRAIAAREEQLGALVLDHQALQAPAPELIISGMLEGIRFNGLAALPWNKINESFKQRIHFMRGVNQFASEPYPDVTDQSLSDTLEEWLAPYLSGMSKLEHLKKLNLKDILMSLLSWSQQQQLEQQAPERWVAPSGSHIQINYTTPEEPKISIRLQELFGLFDTPVIGFGQRPVTIELLSPAQRPVQTTKDLRNFWQTTYHEVKKDLKGRYPKHYWPDDPFEAEATRFVRPRK